MSVRTLTRRRLVGGIAAVGFAPTRLRARDSDSWRPAESVRIIVPVAPGGSNDVVARLLAAHLRSTWDRPVVVDNRSGAGGTIGVSDLVAQKGDGHTILVSNPGPTAVAYSIFRSLSYTPGDLQPVSNMMRIPNIVSAHPSTGIGSIAELIAHLRARPDGLTYGSSGIGQTPHLAAAWFLQLTGLKMTHVPFRGAGPALQAALSGDVQVLFDNLYPSLPQVTAGRLIGLAVTTPERTDWAADLPTMRESAGELADFDMSSWCGVFLPKGASEATVRSLNAEVKACLERDDAKRQIATMGARADHGTPQRFSDFVAAETRKFAGIIQKEGLQMDVQ